MPSKLPQAKKSVKEKIFQSAIDLFSWKGYAGTSVREIAGLSGISESSLYNHYRNKAALLETIFDTYQNEIRKFRATEKQIDQALELYKPEKLLELGLIGFQNSFDNPNLSKITQIILLELTRSETARQFFLEESILEPRRAMVRLFQKMKEKDLIRDLDTETLSCLYNSTIAYFYQELMIARLDGRKTGTIIDKMRRQIDFLWSVIKK